LRIANNPYLAGLDEVILRYECAGRYECENGSIFICPIGKEPLRYLHKLFINNDKQLSSKLERAFKYTPPEDYLNLMNCYNGMTLFDNTFSIYGLYTDFSRSLRLEDQRPISLQNEIVSKNWLFGPENSWRPIGSVSGYEKLFELEIDPSGRARLLCGEGVAKVSASFKELLFDVGSILDRLSNQEGMIDASKRSIDVEMGAFLRS
jgi:hypothetical protein